jgi:hypothetical protein
MAKNSYHLMEPSDGKRTVHRQGWAIDKNKVALAILNE